MKYIFLLSGDYIGLAKEEILGLFDVRKYSLFGSLLIADLKNDVKSLIKLSRRLALTKIIFRLLFECKLSELTKLMKKYDWDSAYSGSFALRINYLDGNKLYSEKNLAKYIWRSVNKPKVDLENPKTKIELFVNRNKVYCGLLTYENNEDFESRKSHLRPFPHPSSLHPKLARALVNIAGVKKNQTLLDPFCGTGGFLIEAGLMDIKVVGCDISKNMAKGCRENLNYFRIKNYKIINKNALDIDKKFDCVVTDLPYGLNSNVYLQFNKNSLKNDKCNKINLKAKKSNQIKKIGQFYLEFLKKLRKILLCRAVIIFPSYVNYKKLVKNAEFRIEKKFSIYVHRSLTRKIVLLRNQ